MGIAASMRELAEGIAASHEDRTKAVLEIREEANRVSADARALIKGFQASRRKEGAQLRKELAQGVTERRSEVNGTLKDAQQTIGSYRSHRKEMGVELLRGLAESRSSRKSEVEDLLRDLGRSRQETGKKLRKDLTKSRADRESGVKEMRSEFRNSRADVRGDINEARTAWQGLTRGVKKATVKATSKAVKAEVAKAAPAEEETPNLGAKLLAAIREHPQGITLTEVAEGIGVAPIVLGRAARRLLDEGKARKEARAYFPVASK